MKNKLTKSSKVTIGVFIFIIVTYVLEVMILRWPWYALLLTYAAVLLISFLLFYSSFIAIIGNYNYATGKTETARKFLKMAIAKNTKSPTAYLNYSIMLVREGNGQLALDYLKISQSLNPKIITDKNIMLTMGSCYWVMGEIEKAIDILEKLRAKYEYVNAHVLTTLGYMYFLSGDIEKALEFTNKALEESPESGAAWDNLGQIYYKTREMEKSKESFLKAIGFKSDLVDSYYYLGLIAEEEKNLDEARGYFEKARNCKISSLNTVTKEQVEEKYASVQ